MVLWLQEFDLVSKHLAHSKVTASDSLFVTISIDQSLCLTKLLTIFSWIS